MLENLDPNIYLNFTQIHKSIYSTVIAFNTEFSFSKYSISEDWLTEWLESHLPLA